jgi:hypothetical protein
MHLAKLLLSLMLSSSAMAHPGHAIEDELQKRGEFLAGHTNNLDHCASVNQAEGLTKRAEERRAARFDQLLQHRGLPSTMTDSASDITKLTVYQSGKHPPSASLTNRTSRTPQRRVLPKFLLIASLVC